MRRPRYDLAARPFIVIWEATRACQLVCRHCRAEAVPDRDPRELTTEEAATLMAQVASFGPPSPLFVITGGDPFERPDLDELIRTGTRLGLPVSVSPSGTPALTEASLLRVHEAGAVAISLSVDGASADVHDGFRGIPGVFDRTIEAWRAARGVGLKVQVNTTVTARTMTELPEILRLVIELGALAWSVFFLVPTGRGRELEQMTPQEFEDVLNFLYDANKVVSVKATEGHHFRRVVIQRRILEERGMAPEEVLSLGPTYRLLRAELEAIVGPETERPSAIRRAPLDVASGRGFVFVSHVGDVFPSGFLPIPAGNVRQRPLPEIYRGSLLFASLRDPDLLEGRCGRCEFRGVCGGSRSRAFGATGDLLAEEPGCLYEPGSFPFPEEVAALLA
ncbi:MAG: TIGR04053 family radical SAM/SPASM domain-containing protein [Actinobacteria bacterium]|nr:TIGR04053 family radical SAM/SPASM domain-containing protein [Actinomycetota bacterium]